LGLDLRLFHSVGPASASAICLTQPLWHQSRWLPEVKLLAEQVGSVAIDGPFRCRCRSHHLLDSRQALAPWSSMLYQLADSNYCRVFVELNFKTGQLALLIFGRWSHFASKTQRIRHFSDIYWK